MEIKKLESEMLCDCWNHVLKEIRWRKKFNSWLIGYCQKSKHRNRAFLWLSLRELLGSLYMFKKWHWYNYKLIFRKKSQPNCEIDAYINLNHDHPTKYIWKNIKWNITIILSDDYSFILVLSCFDSYLGFSGWHYSLE